MINSRVIIFVLGLLLLLEGAFMVLSMFIAIIYNGPDIPAFLFSSLITFATGGVAAYATRKGSRSIGKREGYIIVSLVWVLFSLFGCIPFIVSGAIPDFTNAFFETMSGFTTTGASILNDIESLPHGILFWRSITQWIGGMGMIVMSVAIFTMLGIGGMQLFIAEVPGPTPDKLHPKVKETAKRLWAIYIIYTVAQTILMMFGGMNLFDAINHAFTTMATGGYSTKQSSITDFNIYIQYVIIVFMFIAGTNFTLSYHAMHLQFKKVLKNEEFRFYFGIVVAFTLVITLILAFTKGYGFEQSFRDSLFQIVSLITTTGFATADYLQWGHFAIVLLFVVMFFGGSAGSTGGGIKIVRILLLLKNAYLEFKRLVHPNAIIPARLNRKAVQPYIMTNILAFFVFYIFIFAIGTIIMSGLGLDLDSAMGSVIACLGNIGPGIGDVGPSSNFFPIHDAGKWVLSLLMVIGRLELFTVLILFTPSFWKN